MEITEDLGFRAELVKRIANREFSERTGVHQSDLVYCLNKAALRKIQPQEDTDQETLMFSIGYATQRWLTGQDKDAPEKEVDGIKVTCDALEGSIPFELKCSYQSSNKNIEENTAWLKQIQAQCYVQDSLIAYLSRFELMGDWKGIFKPKEYKTYTPEEKATYAKEHPRPTLHAYRLEFTKEEIERNWAWLRQRRELFLQVIETGELLPKVQALPSGQGWECDWCKFKIDCEGG